MRTVLLPGGRQRGSARAYVTEPQCYKQQAVMNTAVFPKQVCACAAAYEKLEAIKLLLLPHWDPAGKSTEMMGVAFPLRWRCWCKAWLLQSALLVSDIKAFVGS